MGNLGEIKIEVYVSQTRVLAAPLSEEQKGLIRLLVIKTLDRGFWAKSALRNALLEEMVNTARHIGGPTLAGIEYLMAGIDISVGLKKEGDKEEQNGEYRRS